MYGCRNLINRYITIQGYLKGRPKINAKSHKLKIPPSLHTTNIECIQEDMSPHLGKTDTSHQLKKKRVVPAPHLLCTKNLQRISLVIQGY